MPNTPVWGSATEDREANQDLVSLGNEIIEVVDIDDDERTALFAKNSNGIVMDNSVDVLTGNGMIFNPDGHPGPLEPCIDFYINSVCTFYVDSAGGHNV